MSTDQVPNLNVYSETQRVLNVAAAEGRARVEKQFQWCDECRNRGRVICDGCDEYGADEVASGKVRCRKCWGAREVACPKCGGESAA